MRSRISPSLLRSVYQRCGPLKNAGLSVVLAALAASPILTAGDYSVRRYRPSKVRCSGPRRRLTTIPPITKPEHFLAIQTLPNLAFPLPLLYSFVSHISDTPAFNSAFVTPFPTFLRRIFDFNFHTVGDGTRAFQFVKTVYMPSLNSHFTKATTRKQKYAAMGRTPRATARSDSEAHALKFKCTGSCNQRHPEHSVWCHGYTPSLRCHLGYSKIQQRNKRYLFSCGMNYI